MRWKQIPGYEGFYSVSHTGLVRRDTTEKILKPSPTGKTGYVSVDLSKKGKRKRINIHRLVMLAFVSPCPPGLEVNHIDGKRTNNRRDNLEYVTRSENHLNAYRDRGVKVNQGSNHGMSRLTEQKVKRIRRLIRKGWSLKRIAKKFRVDPSCISRIKSYELWKHV